jgi:hypothetical protein
MDGFLIQSKTFEQMFMLEIQKCKKNLLTQL